MSRPEPTAASDVIVLAGELDFSSVRSVQDRLGQAVESGNSIIVDLADCTFFDLAVLRALNEAHMHASTHGQRFVVVVPFTAAPVVRLLLLELAADLATFPLVPTRVAAAAHIARKVVSTGHAEYLRDLRARTWHLLRRQEELLARRDALMLEVRAAAAALAAARASS